MTTFEMTIDGAAVSAPESFDVINPASGLVFEQAPECPTETVDLAFMSAHRALTTWRVDEGERRAALRRIADLLLSVVDDLAPVLTAEQGKPLLMARGEIVRAASWFSYFAELPMPYDVIQDDALALVEVVARPVGVVAAIAPWNSPLMLASWKLAPALLAGNTVVLKPSPYTPLSTLLLGRYLATVLPPGVVNVIAGADSVGRAMVSHPLTRKISFTGSVAAGKQIAAAAAPDLKRTTLELGGNDAAIILADADPAAIAKKLFWGAFLNNGQVCSAVKRVYAHESIHCAVVEALADLATRTRVGDGSVDGVELGPVANKAQLVRVSGMVAQALAGGAKAAAGGAALSQPGYFFPPTVLTGVDDSMSIVADEQFGPALPVMAFRDVDDAVCRANSTPFGLSGSVWSSDLDHARSIAARLDCGTAWINDHAVVSPEQPFGGVGWSGVGLENGHWGLDGFIQTQVVRTTRSAAG